MNKKNTMKQIDALLNSGQGTPTSKAILDVAKINLQSGKFDTFDAENFIKKNFSQMKVTEGKKLSDEENKYLNQLYLKRPSRYSFFANVSLSDVKNILKDIQEQHNE